ncbi:caprin-2-like [Gigantopelta aegis]|uniref:caprin-2-like n=1 Tax=Gigantopelta aegis TaxID=1735272 RepID=UPI001B88AEF1|nr:caprin-2-like [Gigantopelta aegis]
MYRSVACGAVLLTFISVLWGTFSVEATGQRAPQIQRVAFSAGRTSHLHLQNATNITYDRVFTNIGNGYNKTSGIFTVPEGAAGTYVFMFHGLAQRSGKFWLDLYKNSVYVISAYAHTSHEFGSSSNVAAMELQEGDYVHIQGRGDNLLFGKSDEVYNTFNGYLLYPAILRPKYGMSNVLN